MRHSIFDSFFSPQRGRREVSLLIKWLAVSPLLAAGAWWFWPRGPVNGGATNPQTGDANLRGVHAAADKPVAVAPEKMTAQAPPVLAAAVADEPKPAAANDNTSLLAALTPEDKPTRPADTPSPAENAEIAAARGMLTAGKTLAARTRLNACLTRRDLTPAELADVRDLLATIANETIFSNVRLADDPLVETYTLVQNDNLQKIGRKFDTPHEILMQINGIRDANRINAGERIKVLRGPFHVQICLSQCRLDVFLQDTYVRSYRVAIGKPESPTPVGAWKVTKRERNPTYYSPPSAAKREVIGSNDPRNPLGGHWLGLEGVSGDAKGRTGFGIHGTIEPDSIGRAASDGCIRLLNDDAAFLFGVLVSEKSTVTTVP